MHSPNMCIGNKLEMKLVSYNYIPSLELDTYGPLIVNGGQLALVETDSPYLL